MIQRIKQLFKKPYTMDFQCDTCKATIVLRSDVPIMDDKIYCIKGAHIGAVSIPTKKNGC